MRELIVEYFVNLKDLSFEQAEKILQVQNYKKNRKKKIGEIALELGFLEPGEVHEYIKEPSSQKSD